MGILTKKIGNNSRITLYRYHMGRLEQPENLTSVSAWRYETSCIIENNFKIHYFVPTKTSSYYWDTLYIFSNQKQF